MGPGQHSCRGCLRGHDTHRAARIHRLRAVRRRQHHRRAGVDLLELHEIVGCKSTYEFLGSSKDASLSDLRIAADKKYVCIHNQRSRSEVAHGGTDLAGLCKSHILKDARCNWEHDQPLLAQSRKADDRPEDRQPSPFGGRTALALARVGLGAVAAPHIAPFLPPTGGAPAAGGTESVSSAAPAEPPPPGGSAAAIILESPSQAQEALRADRSARHRIQAGLVEAGLSAGSVDGLFSPGTLNGFGRWQAACGGTPASYLNAAEAAAWSEVCADCLARFASAVARPEDPPPARAAAGITRTPVRPRFVRGTLTVCAVPASRTELDGADVRATCATGTLLLFNVQPARHVIVARKDGGAGATGVVKVADRRAEVLELAMASLPGCLTATASVAGVSLWIDDAGGEHRLAWAGLELPAGSHSVTASREGFRTLVNEIDINPAAITTLDLKLEPIPIDELLQVAAARLAAGDYRGAAEVARALVSMRPDASDAYRLLETALYERGACAESTAPLSRALTLGQQVVLSVKHRHCATVLRAGLCTGMIALGSNAITFRSQHEPDHSFTTTPGGIANVEPRQFTYPNAVRLNASAPEANTGERRDNLDFLHKHTERTRQEPESSFPVLICRNCEASAERPARAHEPPPGVGTARDY